MRPSSPLGTTGEGEYSPEGAEDGAAAGTMRRACVVSQGAQNAARFTFQHEPDNGQVPQPPQQRPPLLRQSSTPGAAPSCPRANQARTPPANSWPTGSPGQAAESTESVRDGPRPRRQMAGSGMEAVALLIRGTRPERRGPAREPEAF